MCWCRPEIRTPFCGRPECHPPQGKAERQLISLVEQLCKDLNQAHDEIVRLQGKDPSKYDWPEWTPQANSIRWAETLLEKKLAKTDQWSMHPTSKQIATNEGSISEIGRGLV